MEWFDSMSNLKKDSKEIVVQPEPFNPRATCRKCKETHILKYHCNGAGNSRMWATLNTSGCSTHKIGHFHRMCPGCNYQWIETSPEDEFVASLEKAYSFTTPEVPTTTLPGFRSPREEIRSQVADMIAEQRNNAIWKKWVDGSS